MRFLLFFLMFMPYVWADYAVGTSKDVELSSLTSEAKILVPSLEGMSGKYDGKVKFRKIGGEEFTEAEKALLEQAVSEHDPNVLEKKKAKKDKDRKEARKKLKALGLTDDELDAIGITE